MEKSVVVIESFRQPVIVANDGLKLALQNAIYRAAEEVGHDFFARAVCERECEQAKIAA